MKLAMTLFALTFGALTLVAQSARPAQLMAKRGVDVSAGCPVAMHLDQSVMGGATNARNGQSTKRFQTKLHLIASGAQQAKYRASDIKSAQVTAYGIDSTPRFELTWSMQGNRSGPAKSMTVNFVPEANGGAEANFVVASLPAVSMLDVNSITFANGSTWKPMPGHACSVMPDPFVLVSEHSH